MERIHVINALYKIPEQIKHFALLTILRYVIYTSINLFLPAYIIYKYDLKTSLFYISLQYFFVYLFISISVLRKLASKHSAEMIQIIATILGILGIVIVFLIKGMFGLVISAFLLNLNFTLYWLSKHYIIINYAKKRDEIEESVIIDSVGRIASLILPPLSSYIIYSLGYSLYYAIIIFIILSVVAYIINKTKKKGTYLNIPHHINWKFVYLFLLEGVFTTSWLLTTTVLLFYNVHSNVKFYGILKGASQIVIIGMSFYIAKMIDKRHNMKISIVSIVVFSLMVYCYALFKTHPYVVATVSILISLFYNLGSLSPIAFVYEYAKLFDPTIIIAREMLLSISRFFIVFLTIFSQDILYVVAILSLLYVFVFYEVAMKHRHIL